MEQQFSGANFVNKGVLDTVPQELPTAVFDVEPLDDVQAPLITFTDSPEEEVGVPGKNITLDDKEVILSGDEDIPSKMVFVIGEDHWDEEKKGMAISTPASSSGSLSPCKVSRKPAPKKRGRKPLLNTTQRKAIAKKYRLPRERKKKAYENTIPFPDPEMEKKRLNAIRAKNYRDQVKKEMENMKKDRETLTTEKDQLYQEALHLRNRLHDLELQLQQQEQTVAI